MEQDKKCIGIEKTQENVLKHFETVLGDKYKEYEFSFCQHNSLFYINPVEKREMDVLEKDSLLEKAIDTMPHRCMVCLEDNVF
ncbi:uncharacterized protein AC631_05664 [Debaryomyces fabryi]|uniref:Uncharacterized protein n=1 Tax=Debaryomyces fabryi TaxID=58627 RepID=A0A0V1PRD0_9ASCO|nr:uncharacterized protein AC631_05664 [Debaryomyces fabryi]KRZ98574.1 hypothetical protein AC631_05664 [Debaryomyces fabryi]CUM56008.1 unnamed protein product [Debaryomyces fabryi]